MASCSLQAYWPGLRQIGVFRQLMALAEQRLDMFLREMDVMRRDLDEERFAVSAPRAPA